VGRRFCDSAAELIPIFNGFAGSFSCVFLGKVQCSKHGRDVRNEPETNRNEPETNRNEPETNRNEPERTGTNRNEPERTANSPENFTKTPNATTADPRL
jgi:hypothetical protein